MSVGALRRQVATADKTAFAVRLRRVARRALARHERLAVDLRIVINATERARDDEDRPRDAATRRLGHRRLSPCAGACCARRRAA